MSFGEAIQTVFRNGWGHLFWILVPIAGLVVLVAIWAQPTKAAEAATTAVTA